MLKTYHWLLNSSRNLKVVLLFATRCLGSDVHDPYKVMASTYKATYPEPFSYWAVQRIGNPCIILFSGIYDSAR